MKNQYRILAVLAILVFLCSPAPTISGPLDALMAVAGKAVGPYIKKLKNPESYKWIYEEKFDIIEFIKDSLDDDKEDRSISTTTATTGAIPDGFLLPFTIGTGQQNQTVKAWISLSSRITQLENYSPAYSVSLRCCQIDQPKNCTPPAQPASTNQLYTPCSMRNIRPADQFSLFDSYTLHNVMYTWNTNVSNESEPTGLISLSRSNESLVYHFKDYKFSYLMSFSNKSNFVIGITPPGSFQSTELVDDLGPDYQHLYAVKLAGITVQDTSIGINSTTVIIDTIVGVTLLEAAVYDAVMKGLVSKNRAWKNTSTDPLCYDIKDKVDWPDLSFYFPSLSSSSAYVPMVLTKNNYVYTDLSTKSECAAILRSERWSVIGSMAQLDREMIFDVKEKVLQFSKYSVSQASGGTKQSGSSTATHSTSSAVETEPKVASSFIVIVLFALSWASWFTLV